MAVINDTTNKVVATIPVGLKPTAMASVAHEPSNLYVISNSPRDLYVIDGATHKSIDTVQVGIHPITVAQFMGLPSLSSDYAAGLCKNHLAIC